MTSIHGSLAGFLQAGLLAYGSSYLLRLPIPVGTMVNGSLISPTLDIRMAIVYIFPV